MKRIISIALAVLMMLSMLVVTTSAATSYETESNDTYSTADTLGLNKSIEGIMNNGNDIDIYKVTVSSNGKLTFTFNHTFVDNKYVIWYVSIYYYASGVYEELSSMEIRGNQAETITFPSIGAVKNGAYYIKIYTSTAWPDTFNRKYVIENSFVTSENYEKEKNDTYTTANVVSLNMAYRGYMNNGNDIDIYKVSATSNGDLTFKFNHTFIDNKYVIWYVSVHQYVNGEYKELYSKEIKGNQAESISFSKISATKNSNYFVKVKTSTAWPDTFNCEYSIIVEMPVTTYTVSYNANGGTGAPASQTKTHGTALTLSSTKPTRTGYTFLGWSTSKTAISATYKPGSIFTTNANTVLYAVWQKNNSGDSNTFTFNIQEPSTSTIRCNDGIVLHADIDGKLPSGATIEWTWNNSNFDVDVTSDGSKCTIISNNKGYTVFTATVYDVNGSKLATDSVEMYSKAGFFDKIGGFFRSLFGATTIYDK